VWFAGNACWAYVPLMRKTWLGLVTALCLGATSAWTASTSCTATYDTEEKASVVSLLKAKIGDSYKQFDLDKPILVNLITTGVPTMETINGNIRIDPRKYSWIGFPRSKAGLAHPKDVPPSEVIVVAFNACSDRAVGYQLLH